MDCENINNLLSALIDKELSPREARRVRAHVAHCIRCAEDLTELEGVRRLLRNAPSSQPSPGFWADTLQNLRRLSSRNARHNRHIFRVPARAAAALAVVALGCALLSQGSLREPTVRTNTIDPAQLVLLHADLRTDLPLADSGSMRYVFTDMRTNELPPISNSEVD